MTVEAAAFVRAIAVDFEALAVQFETTAVSAVAGLATYSLLHFTHHLRVRLSLGDSLEAGQSFHHRVQFLERAHSSVVE